jgi:hypothetical protein
MCGTKLAHGHEIRLVKHELDAKVPAEGEKQ